MSVSVLVPIDDGPIRRALWGWLRRHYEMRLPGWELKVGSAPADGWSKGRAVESAVRQASGDIFVIADADSWVSPIVLLEAVDAIAAGAAWVTPHETVRRLNPSTTSLLLRNAVEFEDLTVKHRARVHDAVAGGGITVLARDAYEEVGGIDWRFLHWGGEDVAFGCALETLVGEPLNLGATLWHLWHPDDPFRRRSLNDTLGGRYLEARGDVAAMTELVVEAALARTVARYDPVWGVDGSRGRTIGRSSIHPTRPRNRPGCRRGS